MKIIADFPKIHELSMSEVHSRIKTKRKIIQKFKKFENQVAVYENKENERRQRFIDNYCPQIPDSYLPFLQNTFPKIKFESAEEILFKDVPIKYSEYMKQSQLDKEFHELSSDEDDEDVYLKDIEAKEGQIMELKRQVKQYSD